MTCFDTDYVCELSLSSTNFQPRPGRGYLRHRPGWEGDGTLKKLILILSFCLLASVSYADGIGMPGTVPALNPGTRTAILSWDAPTTRVGGASMTSAEIQGYKIYYGTASGVYPYSITFGAITEAASQEVA